MTWLWNGFATGCGANAWGVCIGGFGVSCCGGTPWSVCPDWAAGGACPPGGTPTGVIAMLGVETVGFGGIGGAEGCGWVCVGANERCDGGAPGTACTGRAGPVCGRCTRGSGFVSGSCLITAVSSLAT